MELAGKKVLVIGLGKTGLAVVRFLMAREAVVYCHDDNPALNEALPAGVKRLADGDSPSFELVVPSPGVPPTHHLLKRARALHCPLWSEIELAYAFSKTPIVAITGTNGKTTTTSLIGEILAAAGKQVFVGGNIGKPFIEYLESRQQENFVVLELSSFQLLYTSQFKAHVALLLNITRDHTDYHGSLTEYARAKGRLFANQGANDVAIANAADSLVLAQTAASQAKQLRFSSQERLVEGMFLEGNELVRCSGGQERHRYDTRSLTLKGKHNMENIMAAILAAEACGVDEATITRALADFRAAAHRIEFVAQHAGVEFYDDSKGTNVDATLRALEVFSKPIVLLMGGRDKDGDFARLAPSLHARVRLLVLFGQARENIAAQLGMGIAAETLSIPTMREAAAIACTKARSGEVVLLSPGCASFDEFSGYQERGKCFQQIVKEFSNG